MIVPFNLPYGTVAVYGSGITRGQAGFIPNDTKYRFATIYSIGNVYDVSFGVGDSVMWKNVEPECRVVTSNRLTFTIIEQARLVLKEVIP